MTHTPFERFGKAVIILLLVILVLGVFDLRRRQDTILGELRRWQTGWQLDRQIEKQVEEQVKDVLGP